MVFPGWLFLQPAESGPVELKIATVLPLSAHAVEKNVETLYFSGAAVSIENKAADSFSPNALIQKGQESAPLHLKNVVAESTLESTIESSSGNFAVEEPEQMSVHVV